jgi:hypothetical protein
MCLGHSKYLESEISFGPFSLYYSFQISFKGLEVRRLFGKDHSLIVIISFSR